EDEQTPLMLAANVGVLPVAKLLVDHGADVNAVEQWRGQTALMWAAAGNHGEVAELLIAHGADVNVRADAFDWSTQISSEPRGQYRLTGGLTPLLYAARGGCRQCVDAMLAAGADINLPDPDGVTPLIIAIDNQHYDLAAHLMEQGANPHSWDWWGRTPLYVAADMNSYRSGPGEDGDGAGGDTRDAVDMMRLLLEAGVDPDPQLNMHRPGRGGGSGRFTDDLLNSGATPLLRAANSLDIEAIRVLLEHGAMVDLPNAMGVTPLMAAAGFGSPRGVLAGRFTPQDQAKAIAVLDLLLAAGADIDARVLDTTSLTARIARRSSMTDRTGQSAVYGAIGQGWVDVVTYLVEHGASLDILDAEGKTPLDAANGLAGGRVDRPIEAMVSYLEARQAQ
ncbi:MAG TPA: ankyrin repeat domain-containing protein, partial [Hyphomicrobiales bacterium]|nr:ankyrin repeat domain-containing protein [Hyphomicrobiales bacterium]